MSTLKDRISETMKAAMKSGEKERLSFVRNLHAAVRKKEIDDKVTLDDGGVQAIVSSLLKQRQDSLEQFKKGGREDLVTQEQAEIRFLQEYLPPQLSEDEVRKLVAEAVAEAQATTAKDMGKVMKVLMPKVQGKADGKLVSQLVKEKLGS